MKIRTQRQKNALFPARVVIFAFIYGVFCGLLAAAWWRIAQVKQQQSTERTTLVQH